jgi:hypothetical protein
MRTFSILALMASSMELGTRYPITFEPEVRTFERISRHVETALRCLDGVFSIWLLYFRALPFEPNHIMRQRWRLPRKRISKVGWSPALRSECTPSPVRPDNVIDSLHEA